MNSPRARPRIGLPCDHEIPSGRPSMAMFQSYVDALTTAGGDPVPIPFDLPAPAVREMAASLDGLMLAGGKDVNPTRYGATRGHSVLSVDDERDETEITLVCEAIRRDIPLLGICRGMQVLNVALGGTLFQDLPSERPADVAHQVSLSAHRRDGLAHTVEIAKDSRFFAVLGVASVEVNSRHHQAVRELGEGLIASAWAPDGVIEGVERPAGRFVIGVQWHPEDLVEAGLTMRRLFEAFVQEARA